MYPKVGFEGDKFWMPGQSLLSSTIVLNDTKCTTILYVCTNITI